MTGPRSITLPRAVLWEGDSAEVLRSLPDCSVDSIVCDPPYGLSFMGKRWDYDVPGVAIWAECLRVLKPGGHLLAFAGTRTQHRMAVNIEDAGFEIRDMLAWVYGQGFPKSLDVSKAIDAAAGVERPDALKGGHRGMNASGDSWHDGHSELKRAVPPQVGWGDLTRGTPVTDAAQQWQGWGTALKPALEPITLARKPLDGTVAENVMAHGTGGLNIGGCRVEVDPQADARDVGRQITKNVRTEDDGWGMNRSGVQHGVAVVRPEGRWPANLVHDGSPEVLEGFPETKSCGTASDARCEGSVFSGSRTQGAIYPGDSGSAARFFYCAKASRADREEGLSGLPDGILARSSQAQAEARRGNVVTEEGGAFNKARVRKNTHPTVKPTDLMRWLVRLVTPPGGVVLDPFMGSGSTGKAAMLEGFRFIGVDITPEYVEIARARIEHAQRESGVPAPAQDHAPAAGNMVRPAKQPEDPRQMGLFPLDEAA